MTAALEACLRATTEVPARDHVAAWWPRWRDGAAQAATPAAQALLGGFDADRVGWAFAAGYQAALRALRPELPAGVVAAFCVTEDGGNRPRDIHTRFTPTGAGWRIDGSKRWTTLGPDSSVLLIVGALPPAAAEERPRLKVARVDAPRPGLRLQDMPATRFVPEVPHARVQLEGVEVDTDALLPGDGYTTCVKPFRTHEDIHVTLAVLAYLLREARHRRWPSPFAERLCAALVTFTALSGAVADAPATHLALAGALAQAHALYAEASALWAAAGDDPAARRWQRDAALFEVAASARCQRATRAWQQLQS